MEAIMRERERKEQEARKQKGNLGQKEADLEQRSESELEHMGELSEEKNK
jgi:hypothetical protein